MVQRPLVWKRNKSLGIKVLKGDMIREGAAPVLVVAAVMGTISGAVAGIVVGVIVAAILGQVEDIFTVSLNAISNINRLPNTSQMHN